LKIALSKQKLWPEAKRFIAAGAANVWGASRHIAHSKRM
jgi:hypothetical protein